MPYDQSGNLVSPLGDQRQLPVGGVNVYFGGEGPTEVEPTGYVGGVAQSVSDILKVSHILGGDMAGKMIKEKMPAHVTRVTVNNRGGQ